MISQIHKEKIVRAFLALCLFMPMTMSSVLAEEKIEFNFKPNEKGEWCGKFYASRWNNNLKYQCKTQEKWEKLGITFPEDTPQIRLVIGPPILGGDETIRG